MAKNKGSNTSNKIDKQKNKFKIGLKSHNLAKRNVTKTGHGNSEQNFDDNRSMKSRKWKINKNLSLRERMMEKLKSARFRAKSSSLCIADFGCGEAKLAEKLEALAEVHSFDLVAANSRVTKCEMSHTPLQSGCVDVAVFCLSLMGTNLSTFIAEANRVLKEGGVLKIAEVESRFENPDHFIAAIERFGFKSTSKDYSHKVFYFFDFKKLSNISKKRKNKLPEINLKPCLYKKR
ncbi:hypothetical protein LSTR_LSTR003476 [Laodelphax striatellus]|uniref:Ribosomal RNA-processing protein 8 n=1 Tax=Laodelphax striatellus TaxID=195883 RepID=A0A482X036_LAOST|nr:hypothetical protein LSTR_LSTR003476 [Laodelphax striatellus]